ncbi:MAG TPA: fatty acyl-AMP ligase [Myxococcaceae bacterium]|jgi:acyl-CoA synthetase (AMP-forming)/AMP-acid ligase II
MAPPFESLGAMLESRAREARGTVRFLKGRPGDDEVVKVSELAAQAGAIAGNLRALGLKAGDRMAMLLRSNLDFARLFLGATAAGIVPVPLYPPASLDRIDHYLGNLRGILGTVQPAGLVVAREVRQILELVQRDIPGKPVVLELEEALRANGTSVVERVDGGDPAFIQCTSGSTTVPKAVVVTHRNLFANLDALCHDAQDGEGDAMCMWVPMYHDMGLLGFLRPLIYDHSLILMEPQAFLRRPGRWLRAISDHRATISGGPNFAFDLCVRKVSDEERAGLDLSSWRLAYNGAEPIRVEVMRRFLETYEPLGFQRPAMVPCYGMSESTLAASAPRRGEAVLERTFDRAALEQGTAKESAEGVTLVGVGRALPGHDLKVIDPETGEPRPEGEIGLVAVTGPSISGGYLNRPDLTEKAFGPWVKGDDRRWIRTNDFGFFHRGELFVVGRADDVLIVRGRKIAPTDVEAVVEALPGVRKGCTAAVQLASAGEFAVVIETAGEPPPELATEIRAAVSKAFAASPAEVVFVPRGTIPKTSSGKICRAVIRRALADGTLVTRARPAWLQGAALKARIGLSWLRNRLPV